MNMRQLVELDAWKIKQNELGTDQRAYESIFSIGNGSFGQRANFEENILIKVCWAIIQVAYTTLIQLK